MSDIPVRLLINDLAGRINPEINRNFRLNELKKSHTILTELSDKLKPLYDSLRIAVVGSNGKGSTAFFLAELFRRTLTIYTDQNQKERETMLCGLYTSPHLLTVTERIRLNETTVSPELLWEIFNDLRELLKNNYNLLTYFEILTAAALLLFQKFKALIQIYEAGLGGRWDATRMAGSRIIILTGIELEHCTILGYTLEEILIEKLGIITEESELVISVAQRQLTKNKIIHEARKYKKDINLYFFEPPFTAAIQTYLNYNWQFAIYCFEKIVKLNLLPAEIFQENSTAKNATRPLLAGRMEERSIQIGPGNSGSVQLLFDTAHNSAAIQTLLKNAALRESFPGIEGSLLILSATPDRNLSEFINIATIMGYPKIIQLVGDSLHLPVEGCETVQTNELEQKILYYVREKNIAYIIMTGSHRIYRYFKELPDKIEITKQ